MAQTSERIYARLLRAFPPAQRVRYGAEMLQVFRDERRRVREERGVTAGVRYVLAAYADAASAGWQQRRREKDRMSYERAGLLRGFGQDLKHAMRGLSRSWTFTLVCLFSLTVGLGINAALMLFTWGTFAPPAAIRTEGAVELLLTTRGEAQDEAWSYPDFEAVQRAATVLDVTGWSVGTRHLRAEAGVDATSIDMMYVSANYFETLGITLPFGRGFLAEEDVVSGEPAAVVSHDMWQRGLGGGDVLGTVLDLNGMPHRIVGVAPEGYNGHFAGHDVEVWAPLWTHPLLAAGSGRRTDRGAEAVRVIGRLHEGVTLARANAELAPVMRTLAQQHPRTNAERGVGVVAYTVQGEGQTGAIAYAMIMGLALMVLFVVCLNVAGMVLVRSATKQRELSLRMALGSSRWRLARFLMTESAVLALLGGLFSTLASVSLIQYFVWRSGQPPREGMMAVVVATCVVLSIVAMLVIGVSPALRFTRPQLLNAMKDEGAGAGGRRTSRVHRIATSVQTALALPMLVVNIMVLHATGVMDRADYGFEQRNLYVASMDLAVEGYAEDDVAAFLRSVPDALAGVAGVEAVTVGDAVPLDYVGRSHPVTAVGAAEPEYAAASRIGQDYFETIGTPILRGRAIESHDVAGGEPVAVLTQTLAEQLFPGEDALGRRVRFGFEQTGEAEHTVVGISADVAGPSHDSDPVGLFVAATQHPTTRVTIAARGASESDAAATALEDALLRLDPQLTRPVFITSRELMEMQKREIYAMTLFLGSIALMTLLLAAVGIYGVVAFAVTTRTREIGVRMAMGATRTRVLMMVLGDGTRLAGPGIVVGLLLAAFVAHQVVTKFYEYLDRTALDWAVLAGSALGALAVVLLASVLPARRAAGVQPMRALRSD